MKHIYIVIFVLFFLNTFAQQVPSTFNYQAVLRDSNGELKKTTRVLVRFELLQGSSTGEIIYTEVFQALTTDYGLINHEVGSIEPEKFEKIDWSNGPFWLRISIDNQIYGSSQLLSVPFALYAKSSGSNSSLTGDIGISIKDGIIKNTLPDLPVTLTAESGILIGGTYPDFRIGTDVSSSSVIKLSSENYTSEKIDDYSIIQFQGSITMTQDFVCGAKGVTILGGSLTGDGSQVFSVGNNSMVQGLTFNNIDIDCQRITFTNCVFLGDCKRLGYDCRFINCTFSGITTTTDYLVGRIDLSEIQSCTFPRLLCVSNSNILNSELGNSEDFGVSYVYDCKLNNTTIYALTTEMSFIGNRCTNSKINVGSSTRAPSKITIANNSFSNLLVGATEVITIDPSYSTYKVWNITGNSFLLQPSDPQAISISGQDGSLSYSFLNLSSNSFFKCLKTVDYNSDMNVSYTNNVSIRSTDPSSSDNLIVNNTVTF
jgi:hypothetical protein